MLAQTVTWMYYLPVFTSRDLGASWNLGHVIQNDQHPPAMKLKEIHRTATFAWSPFSEPLLVTGTVAGALDESFSNDSQLEIWAPDFKDKSEYDLGQLDQNKPKASITTSSKYAYSY